MTDAERSLPPYRIRELPFSPRDLDGLSEKLMASHYENNYGGAVRRLNAIAAELAAADPAGLPSYRLNGLKREELIAANSKALHEVYFDSLGGKGDPAGELASAIERDFGAVARWRAEFAAMGKALGGGSGWVVLAWSRREGRLVNQWAADHTHAGVDAAPLVALDMYEHAYHLDFGAKAAAYVDAVMRNLAWDKAASRFAAALGKPAAHAAAHGPAIAPEALAGALAVGRFDRMLLDVRRKPAYAASPDIIRGAAWRDPERIGEWAGALPAGAKIAVYCVYGHNVSADTAAALRARGFDAIAVEGGIAAFRAIGGPTQPKEKHA